MRYIERANALIRLLESQRDKRKPLAPQLTQLFVPTLCGKGIVATATLHGKLVTLLNTHQTKASQERTVIRVFSQAVQILHRDAKAAASLPLPLLVELNQIFRKKELDHLEGSLAMDLTTTSSTELKELHAAAQEHSKRLAEHKTAEMRRLSFLRQAEKFPSYTLEKLRELFTLEGPTKFVPQLYQFLKTHGEYAHKKIDASFAMWEGAQKLKMQLQETFFPDGTELSKETKKKKVTEVAEGFTKQVSSLQTGQNWTYHGAYGKESSPLNTLCILLSRLPETTWRHFPAEVASFLKKGSLPDPSEFVTHLIKKGLKQVTEELPSSDDFFNNPAVQALLKDDDRQVSDLIGSIMPNSVKNGLESWLKQGLAGNIAEFIPDGETRDWILWLAEKGHELQDPKKRDLCLKEMVQKASGSIQSPLAPIGSNANGVAKEFLSVFHKYLPTPLLKLSGLDAAINNGQFWLDFCRQKDGRFTVLVYASGAAVTQHPRKSSGEVQWPMRIVDIHPHKVNSEFFQKLLFHYLEQNQDSSYQLRPEDLYQGVLRYLDGSLEERNSEWREVEAGKNSEADFMTVLMERPEMLPGLSVFQMHLEGLLGFCRTKLQNDHLVLSREEAISVEQTLQYVRAEKESLRKSDLKEFHQKVDATLEEIQNAIDKAKNSVTNNPPFKSFNAKLPKETSNIIKNILKSNKTSIASLQSAKATLSWALGEDIGTLIDSLVELSEEDEAVPISETQPEVMVTPSTKKRAAEIEPVKSKQPQGWVRTILFHAYFQMVVQVLQLFMLFSRLYAIGISTLVRPYVSAALHQMIPQALFQWYNTVIAALQRTLAEWILKIILKTLLSSEDAQKLESFFTTYRGKIQSWARSFSKQEVLQLTLEKPIPEKLATAFVVDVPSEKPSEADLKAVNQIRANFPIAQSIKSQTIPSEKILESLQLWRSDLAALSGHFAIDYFVKQTFRLPFPTAEADCWDRIPLKDLMTCIERLSHFSMALRNQSVSRSVFGDFLAAQGTILAIMDKLARRCPDAHLTGYGLDVYPLIVWLKDQDVTIYNPLAAERIMECCAYFMPEVDLDHLPSNTELMKLAKDKLFNYGYLNNGFFEKVGMESRQQRSSLSVVLSNSVLQSAEFRYLEERYLEEETQKKIAALGIDLSELSMRDKFGILLKASELFIEQSGRELLPRPYIFLRLQTLLFKELCRAPDTFLVADGGLGLLCDKNISLLCEVGGIKLQTDCMATYCNYIAATSKTKKSAIKYMIGLHKFSLPLRFQKFRHLLHAYDDYIPEGPTTPTQSDVMVQNARWGMLQEGLWELRRCERSDIITRLFAYFKQYKSALGNWQNFHIYPEFSPFFESILLAQQLKTSPQMAISFGETLSEWIKFYRSSSDNANDETLFQLILFGLRLKKYCEYYAPGYMHAFPDLQKELLELHRQYQDSPYTTLMSDYLALYALSFKDEEQLSESEIEEQLVATCKALFAFTYKHKAFGFGIKNIHLLQNQYERLLPVLAKKIKDEKFLHGLIHTVFDLLKLPIDKTKKWVAHDSPYHLGWLFRCGLYEIDFLTFNAHKLEGGNGVPNHLSLEQIKEEATRLGIPGNKLQTIDKGIVETEDKQFRVIIPKDSGPIFSRMVDGKKYDFVSSKISEEIQRALFQRRDSNHVDTTGMTLWLQDCDDDEKEVLLFQDKQCLAKFSVVRNLENGREYLLPGVAETDPPLEILSGDAVATEFAPLKRFCRLKDIVCFVRPGKSGIDRIEFRRHNLAFQVVSEKDKRLAICEDSALPGFAIASKQQLEQLEGFSAYLVLENRLGQKKVLVPQVEWSHSFIWQFLTYLGPLADAASQFLHIDNQSSSRFYIFDFDEKSGLLTSKEPEALAYLLSQYILQRDSASAEYVCSELIMLCKRKSIPEPLLEKLLPLLFIPTGIENIGLMRARVLAAIEENRLVNIHSKKTSSNEQIALTDLLIDMALISMTFMDLNNNLKETDPRKKLREDQEWFLFKTVFRRIEKVITANVESSFIKARIKDVGIQNLVEHIALPQALSERFTELKKQFGKSDHLLLRTLRVANRFMKAESCLPSLTNPLNNSIHGASGFVPQTNIQNGCSELFHVICSHMLIDSRALDVWELGKGFVPLCVKDVDLTLENITPDILKRQFLSFYSIARNEGLNGQYEKLKRILPLLKGGWDPTTRVLILYLELVVDTPALFWNTEQAVKAFKEKPSKEDALVKISEGHKFFDHLNTRFVAREALVGSAEMAGKMMVNTFISDKVLGLVMPLLQITQPPLIVNYALHWAGKLMTIATSSNVSKSKKEKIEKVKESVVSQPLSCLQEEDDKMNQALQYLFEAAFEEVQPAPFSKESVMPLPISGNAPEREQLMRVNASVREYYARPDRHAMFLRFKGREVLCGQYLTLNAICSKFRRQMEQEKQDLLEAANIGKTEDWVTFNDLLRFFLKGNCEEFIKFTNVPFQSLGKLEMALGRYIVRYTRLQQMQRALGYLEELTMIDPTVNRQSYEQRVQQLADELKAQRAYKFDMPQRLLRRFMLFELVSDKMLWAKQSSCMQNLLLKEQGDVVIELLMSFGKTYFGIPTISSFYDFTFNIWPKSLVESNTEQISRQSNDIFHQGVNVLHFRRDMNFRSENLEAMAILLQRAQQPGKEESVNSTKESMQAVELLFIEKLYRFAHRLNSNSHEEEETALFLNGLLQMMKKSKAIGDEAHELFNDREELNYPLGPKSTVKAKIYQVIEICFRKLLEIPTIQDLIEANNIPKIKEVYESVVKWIRFCGTSL